MKDLREQLLGYGRRFPYESETVERMLALLDSETPFQRSQFAPGHFTASAFVLSPCRQQVALIFHGTLKRWLQPGGHIEAGDASTAAAAQREACEECLLEPEELELLSPLPFDLDIHRIPAKRSEPSHEHFDLRYLFAAKTMRGGAGDGVTGFQFVPFGEVSEHESDASVMRAVERLKAL